MYLQIEQLRFKNAFEYEIVLADDIDASVIFCAAIAVTTVLRKCYLAWTDASDNSGKIARGIFDERRCGALHHHRQRHWN